MMKQIAKEVDLGEVYRVKRLGKDLDPLFWSFGKIHGLENIAYADFDELVAANGNPVAIQRIINKVDGPDKFYGSQQQVETDMQTSMETYKKSISSNPMNSSDNKKLLALPFYLGKRQELPEPRIGQAEFTLFEYMTGQNWYDDAHIQWDPEHKITEFNYEQFIPEDVLKNMDTQSE